MSEVVIIDAVRTPYGKRGGALREFRPDALLAHVLRGVVDRAGIDAAKIEDVVRGTVTQAGEQAANVARLGVLLADFPVSVPGVTLNRMCGSSQQAMHFAAQAIAAGDAHYAIGAGVESMSRVPMFLDLTLGDTYRGFEKLNPQLFEKYELIHQGQSAERVAERWGLTRSDWMSMRRRATVVLRRQCALRRIRS
jgi:acetyl-CoA acyltransferase